jgi:hypothetical protein
MKKAGAYSLIFVFTAGFSLCSTSPSTAAAEAFNPNSCSLAAEVQRENKLQAFSVFDTPPESVHSEALPTSVGEILKRNARADLAGISAEDLKGVNCTNFFQHIDRLIAPKGRWLFVSQTAVPLGSDHFDLVMFDPATGVTSNLAARLNAKWTLYTLNGSGEHRDLKDDRPISWIDLYADGNPVLAFQVLGHNGSFYDAAIYRYFHVGPELDLTPILARETMLTMLDEGPYFRRLSPLGSGRWKLTTTLEQPDRKRKEIGYAVIESLSPGAPFRVVELHPAATRNTDFLISAWGDPDAMLVYGYTYEY